MRTLDLREAAQLLRMHPEEVRRRAKAGELPGAKVGRAWVFVDLDLVDYLRSLYPEGWQALQVTARKESECHFANADQSGGSIFAAPVANEYASLLGLKSRPKRESCTTR